MNSSHDEAVSFFCKEGYSIIQSEMIPFFVRNIFPYATVDLAMLIVAAFPGYNWTVRPYFYSYWNDGNVGVQSNTWPSGLLDSHSLNENTTTNKSPATTGVFYLGRLYFGSLIGTNYGPYQTGTADFGYYLYLNGGLVYNNIGTNLTVQVNGPICFDKIVMDKDGWNYTSPGANAAAYVNSEGLRFDIGKKIK